MDKFINYLNKIKRLTKEKKYNDAWKLANEGITELSKDNDDLWFMMYYQMAIIAAKEKRWENALEKMSYMIHYLKGLGGTTHKKFVLRLLKKIGKEDKFDDYIKLSKEKDIKNIRLSLSKLISK
jgi:hypothetical protein